MFLQAWPQASLNSPVCTSRSPDRCGCTEQLAAIEIQLVPRHAHSQSQRAEATATSERASRWHNVRQAAVRVSHISSPLHALRAGRADLLCWAIACVKGASSWSLIDSAPTPTQRLPVSKCPSLSSLESSYAGRPQPCRPERAQVVEHALQSGVVSARRGNAFLPNGRQCQIAALGPHRRSLIPASGTRQRAPSSFVAADWRSRRPGPRAVNFTVQSRHGRRGSLTYQYNNTRGAKYLLHVNNDENRVNC